MTDQLPDVQLTDEQLIRAAALAVAISEEARPFLAAAGAIVYLRDNLEELHDAHDTLERERDKLNADLAWVRRRTQFWGEVPQDPGAHRFTVLGVPREPHPDQFCECGCGQTYLAVRASLTTGDAPK